MIDNDNNSLEETLWQLFVMTGNLNYYNLRERTKSIEKQEKRKQKQ